MWSTTYTSTGTAIRPSVSPRILKREGWFPIAANHFAALNGLFPLAASKAR